MLWRVRTTLPDRPGAQALADGPTRYLTALRRAVHAGEDLPAVLARLLDADHAEPAEAAEAGGLGAADVVLRGPAESPAAVAMAFSSGLRARVRLAGDELLVTVSTRGMAPLRPVAAPVGAGSAR